jgi:hypothetical protein
MDIYNVEAAEILANEAQLLPIGEAAPIYEKLLSTFPTAVSPVRFRLDVLLALGLHRISIYRFVWFI